MRLSVLTRRRMKGSTSFFKVADLVRSLLLLDGHLEGFAELCFLAQVAWIEEVEDGPQIAQAVLDRRASQGKSMWRSELENRACLGRLWILDVLGLVDHNAMPLQARKSFSSRRANAKEVRTTSCI